MPKFVAESQTSLMPKWKRKTQRNRKKIAALIICFPIFLLGLFHIVTSPREIPPDLIIFQNVEVTDQSIRVKGQLFRSTDTFLHYVYTVNDNEVVITFYKNNILKLVLLNEYGDCFINFAIFGDFKDVDKVSAYYNGKIRETLWEQEKCEIF